MKKNHIYNLGLLFYKVAETYSEKTVLLYPSGVKVSYKQLNIRSNQIARFLQIKGVQSGNVVGFFNNKSIDAYAGMLACLKLGAIYTNWDIATPEERAKKIIGNCKPVLIFNDGASMELAEVVKAYCPVIDIYSKVFLDEVGKLGTEDMVELSSNVSGSSPAYLMYTSGSTGFPKGAVISHDNIRNFISWSADTFGIHEKDIITNVNPMYFDNSVFDFYNGLFSGATLTPVSDSIVRDPQKLVSTINNLQCTIWFSVPSLLVYIITARALGKDDFSSVKRIVFAGEGFPKPKLKNLYDLVGDRIDLFNCYGPTETTCLCSSYVVSEKDFENLNELAPLGFMAPNYEYVILPEDDKNPDFGELCLAGPGVGLGYYNDEERTKKSFIQNPYNTVYPQMVYKTGDLVKKMQNGHLHFKGRKDFQIKHMGYRIELEEIEAAINSVSGVKEAAVIYNNLGNGMGHIVAFVNAVETVSEKQITDDVKKIVPHYMIPKKIRMLSPLPKNKNGKIDRVYLKEIIN